MASAQAQVTGGEPNPVDRNGLCLLSLDGGGVRGLSTLFILKGIMDRLNHERQRMGLPSMKPCEMFDLIGGTSTGGLIAIMLGLLEMDVDECIAAYTKLIREVFSEALHRSPVGITGKIQARFDSKKLQDAIEAVLVNKDVPVTTRLNNGTERGCKVFVCAASKETGSIARLRSYSLPMKTDTSATICEAALATSAATGLFDPVSIGPRKYVDGPLGANNPVDQVEDEASNLWCSESGNLKPLVKCFISLGTGNPGKKSIQDRLDKFVSDTLISISTDTEATAEKFIGRWRQHYDSNQYFRFNVEQGLQQVGVAEYEQQGLIEAATEEYLEGQAQTFRVRDCVENLKEKPKYADDMLENVYTTWHNTKTSTARFALRFKLREEVNSVSHFVARHEELGRLYKELNWTGDRRTVILHGLGGMGKTQTTIAFAKKHRDDYSAVLWLDARDTTTLKQSYRRLAQRIMKETTSVTYINNALSNPDLDETVSAVKRWLDEPKNNRWLMIYDNYDDVKLHTRRSPSGNGTGLQVRNENNAGETGSKAYDIRPFFPNTEHGAILITTRSSSVKLGQRVQLGKLADLEDSLAILASTSGRTDLSKDPDATVLAKKLDGLPLALATAGAYLDQVATSCREYLEMYEKAWLHLQEESPGLTEYDHILYTTWDISLRHIRLQNQNAADLLRLWAYFDNHDVWYELLRAGKSEKPLWLHNMMEDRLNFDKVVRVLCDHGLVEPNAAVSEPGSESQGYSMHGCVHAWTIHVLNTERSQALAWIAIQCVASHVPSQQQSNYWVVQRRLLQHADRCVKMVDTSVDLEDNAWIFQALGNLYSDQGRLNEAEAMYERALQGYEKALGPDHTSTLITVNNLGNLYSNQGRLKEAEAMYEQALQGKEKALGPDHTSTLDTVNNLGLLYSDQGRITEAEAMYERALQGKEKALGPDHMSTLCTVGNLANLYRDQGRFKESEAMYEWALQGYEKALGLDHTSTLSTVSNLANLYRDQGRVKEAEKMYDRALQGKEKAWGPEHTSTLDTVNNLGTLYKDQGRLEEAKTMYERALQGKEKALGSDHPSTLITINDLGLLYFNQRRLQEAEAMYQEALEGKKKALGPHHPSTLNTVDNLCLLYEDQNQHTAAENLRSNYYNELRQESDLSHVHPGDCDSTLIGSSSLNSTGETNQFADSSATLNPSVVHTVDDQLTGTCVDENEVRSVVSNDEDIQSHISLKTRGGAAAERQIISLLASETRLLEILEHATGYIPPDRLQRNLRRLLKSFYVELRKEARTELQRLSIQVLRGRNSRTRISNGILDSISPQSEMDAQDVDLSRDSFRKDRADVDNWLRQVENVDAIRQQEEPFLVRHDAALQFMPKAAQEEDSSSDYSDGPETGDDFRSLQRAEEFLIGGSPYQGLLTSLIFHGLPSKLQQVLQISRSETRTFSGRKEDSLSDGLKRFMELHTGCRWNWWPFSPLLPPLAPGQERVIWECYCGQRLWEDISPSQARILQNMTSQIFSPLTDAITHPCKRFRNRPNLLQRVAFWILSTIQRLGHLSGLAPNRASDAPAGIAGPLEHELEELGGQGLQPATRHRDPETDQSNDLRILFGIQVNGQTPRLIEIPLLQCSEGALFSRLRTTYRQTRGLWRLWLSFWQFSHCDFVKFEKIAPGRVLPCCQELPTDPDYDYEPRPPAAPLPPIHPHVFNIAFNSCGTDCRVPYLHDCFEIDERDLATCIPKKKSPFDLQTSNRSVKFAWGIEAKYSISCVHVILYHMLILTIPFALWGWWLKKYPDDIQSASIPLTVVLAFLSMFWSAK